MTTAAPAAIPSDLERFRRRRGSAAPLPSPEAPPQRPSRPSRRWSTAAATLGAALAAGPGCGPDEPQPGGPGAVVVQTAAVERRTLPRVVSAVGSLESPEPSTVAAEVPGTVVFIDVPEGERVPAGHVLARLDDEELRARVAADRARFRNAEDRLRRVRRLHDQGVASQQALDDAVSAHDAARAALDESGTRLRKTAIRAPFEGVLGLRQVSRGDYVAAGDPIVRITQVDPLELVFGVPQRHARAVAVGQAVLGTVGPCEARFEAQVSAVDPRIDPTTRTVQLEARVPDPDGALAPGMAVRVRLVIGEIPDARVVPQEAIVRQGTKHLVYVVQDDGTVATREVTLGEFFVDGVQVEEVEGAEGVDGELAAGDEVVVAGQQKLRPGTSVETRPRRPTDNPVLDLGWMGPPEGCEPPGP